MRANNQPPPARGPFWGTFGAPIVVGVVSTVGLLAALVGDGLYDGLSWLGLGIPVAIILWALAPPRLRRR